jgi:hypothetical protein
MKYLKNFNLFEAVGVPSGIVETAEQIYNDIDIEEILNTIDVSYNVTHKYSLGDYKIADLELNNLQFKFFIEEEEEYDEDEEYQNKEYPILNKLQVFWGVENYIEMFILIGYHTSRSEISQFFKKEKKKIINFISHELKHLYDQSKDKKGHNNLNYSKYNPPNSGYIMDFFFKDMQYWVHKIENLVRTTEMAMDMHQNNITKKDFYKYLTDKDIYQHLKYYASYTYEKLKKILKNKIASNQGILNDPEYKGLPVDQIVEEILNLNYKYHIHDQYKKLDKETAELYKKRIYKYGDNYEKWYKAEIKEMNINCEKTLKKLSKLYSIAKD